MYADATVTWFANLGLILQKGFQAFRRCLKVNHPYLSVNGRGILRSRGFWMVLEKVRIQWCVIEIVG